MSTASSSSTPARTSSTSLSMSQPSSLNAIDWIALVLMIVGSVNWGLVGMANFNLVAALFGEGTILSRIVYSLVGLAGLYGIALALKLGSGNRSA